ncbi:oligosaccharide biosynthesis protein Alg14 like-domain-containing protein [Dioszegia hungarica]|uniref:UDP-N-acetylglucosamine transferase subunit ALG14 n=1 Tax=Dioszegia hungarica TaxID=4972 RepID=A0AA38H8S6_9TREE|nr:oligosaccharide biosynthesis protein Alg14 like-domain-containing protein [Dioszegia hungarica]KAI9636617.1 oligosaccharide biosynthesis protein Alg14 like-domain-containing protein [Dioszegia hungarica]
MTAALLLIALSVALPLLLALRVYLVLPDSSKPASRRKDGEKCSLGIFLGSGGHTSEMRTLLSGLDFERYTPRTYVYCPGDDMSLKIVRDLEIAKGSSTESYHLVQLPRARRVAQPLLSTVLTSLKTLWVAFRLFFLQPLLSRPASPWVDVLLVNGPGTCVLVVAVSWIRRILGLRYTKIIYVESFARVKSLSLSGKILRPFVDTFVVQWPDAAGPSNGLPAHSETDGGAICGVGLRDGEGNVTNRVEYKGWLV